MGGMAVLDTLPSFYAALLHDITRRSRTVLWGRGRQIVLRFRDWSAVSNQLDIIQSFIMHFIR
jgi:hypothetical protein